MGTYLVHSSIKIIINYEFPSGTTSYFIPTTVRLRPWLRFSSDRSATHHLRLGARCDCSFSHLKQSQLNRRIFAA